MKSLLFVSPWYAPVNSADMHRIRQLLPYLPGLGFRPIILCAEPEPGMPTDPLLLADMPPETILIRLKAIPLRFTRFFGLGGIAYRLFFTLLRAGSRLIKEHQPSAVIFSTTQFPVILAGRIWKWRHRIPYLVDYQDPWVGWHYLSVPASARPPKFWLSFWMDRLLEPVSIRQADGIFAVSGSYIQQLQTRYEFLKTVPTLVLPFGGSESDIDTARHHPANRMPWDGEPAGLIHLVYVGRGGSDMVPAIRLLFAALADIRHTNPEWGHRLRLWLVGTSYARAGTGEKTLEPVAADYALSGVVRELPDRIPYFEALSILLAADGLVLPGSTDPAYTASKIYPYILSRRPLLTITHEAGAITDLIRKTACSTAITFSSESDPGTRDARSLIGNWLENRPIPATDWEAFKPYTSLAMTEKLVSWLPIR